jgi:ribose transport system substrate-binding protein
MKKILQALLASSFAVFVTAVAAADQEIAVIVKTADSDFWQNVRKGSTQAVTAFPGYKASFQGAASDTDLAGQVALVENAVNRKVAATRWRPTAPRPTTSPSSQPTTTRRASCARRR